MTATKTVKTTTIVIPAEAGIQKRVLRWIPVFTGMTKDRVIPAKAGIQKYFQEWIPACAGMTVMKTGKTATTFFVLNYCKTIKNILDNKVFSPIHSEKRKYKK